MSNYQFKDIEFKDMIYNPSKVPEGKSIFFVYKELNKYPELLKPPGVGLENEMVMKYIMFMYDPKSPYKYKYHDVLKRKVQVAKEVGFKMDNKKGEFVPKVEKMLRGQNDIVNLKTVIFCRNLKNFKYSYFTILENSYYKLMYELLEGGNVKKQSEMKSMQIELEDLMTEILNNDENKYLQDEFLRYVEEERLQLRPEDIALKLSKKEEPIKEEEVDWEEKDE